MQAGVQINIVWVDGSIDVENVNQILTQQPQQVDEGFCVRIVVSSDMKGVVIVDVR